VSPAVGDDLLDLLPAYLAKQRWFAGVQPDAVRIVDRDEPAKGVEWLLVEAGDARYSVFVGRVASDPEFLLGQDTAVIGVVALLRRAGRSGVGHRPPRRTAAARDRHPSPANGR